MSLLPSLRPQLPRRKLRHRCRRRRRRLPFHRPPGPVPRRYHTFIGGFVVLAILGIVTVGIGAAIAMLIWAFFYNRYYTRRLFEQGCEFADNEAKVSEAKLRLGVAAA